jgi:hypothetical protein
LRLILLSAIALPNFCLAYLPQASWPKSEQPQKSRRFSNLEPLVLKKSQSGDIRSLVVNLK